MVASARTIVVGNEKGGCGKTTLAVNLAALAAEAGLDTLLVDADPGQQSAVRWATRRRDAHPEAPRVHCVSLTARNIRPDLDDLARRYQVIIVDTGAEDSPQLRAAATVADALLVPVQPDPFDLWTLPTMAALYERAHGLNDKLSLSLALNRIPFQLAHAAGAEVRAWIAENVPALNQTGIAELVGRQAYARATGEGLGVTEVTRRDPRATTEILNLYKMVIPT